MWNWPDMLSCRRRQIWMLSNSKCESIYRFISVISHVQSFVEFLNTAVQNRYGVRFRSWVDVNVVHQVAVTLTLVESISTRFA